MFVHNLNMLLEDREQEMIFSLNLGTDTSDER